mgnify:CR=1 FL=1
MNTLPFLTHIKKEKGGYQGQEFLPNESPIPFIETLNFPLDTKLNNQLSDNPISLILKSLKE